MAQPEFDALDDLAINTIRSLAMDGVQRANSGHPGTAMALAPVAWALYGRYLKHDPAAPDWADRDRFVLSCGHASMLLYSALHLSGYELSLDDLKAFRQWGSKTPGHPEVGHTAGVETTTGPLGQGCGISVGMAIAERRMATLLNVGGHQVVDHRTWVICSDGDLMEGVASEAASVAGHLALGKLTWIWDDNRITIDGTTEIAFTESVVSRMASYGWHTLEIEDANDLEVISAAFDAAIAEDSRPTFIRLRSHIAWGAPNAVDTSEAHGAPLGDDEIRATKRVYGLPEDEQFFIPAELSERREVLRGQGAAAHAAWRELETAWREAEPETAALASRLAARELPAIDWPSWELGTKQATRAASGVAINAAAASMAELIGGSADLAGSNKTLIKGEGYFTATDASCRNIAFGIREHAMASIANGITLHGSLRPYVATFLVFSDYMRPAIRLAALMGQPVIYVFTHDSIGLGEDGPTHQPVEHLAALRAIPGLTVIRPADANESAAAWKQAVETTDGPVALVFTRQGLPTLDLETERLAQGAYLARPVIDPEVVLIGTGSELQLALAAADRLASSGHRAQVVSMPSWELFEAQTALYRARILPPGVPRVAIEAASSFGWGAFLGDRGAMVGIDRFGASAPAEVLYRELGITVEAMVEAAEALLR